MVAPPAGAFLLPGPVKMHPRVMEAMAVPAMNHRGPEFKEALAEIRALTQYAFGTHGPVAVLSGSGTAGLEAAVSGLLRKDDRVLNLVNGKFSERVHELCQVFATPTALTFDWGTALDPATAAAALESRQYRAVTLCWNETSTGLTNPIAEIAKVVKQQDALFLVDGITAVGGIENRMEAWGVDALVVGPCGTRRAQRGRALEPGVRIASLRDLVLREPESAHRRAGEGGHAVHARGASVPRLPRGVAPPEGGGPRRPHLPDEDARGGGPKRGRCAWTGTLPRPPVRVEHGDRHPLSSRDR